MSRVARKLPSCIAFNFHALVGLKVALVFYTFVLRQFTVDESFHLDFFKSHHEDSFSSVFSVILLFGNWMVEASSKPLKEAA